MITKTFVFLSSFLLFFYSYKIIAILPYVTFYYTTLITLLQYVDDTTRLFGILSAKVFRIFSRRARRPSKRFGVWAASISGSSPFIRPLQNCVCPQNASLILLVNEPIRVNVFSFVICKRGNSQYPKQED